jgi:hypothetical protein
VCRAASECGECWESSECWCKVFVVLCCTGCFCCNRLSGFLQSAGLWFTPCNWLHGQTTRPVTKKSTHWRATSQQQHKNLLHQALGATHGTQRGQVSTHAQHTLSRQTQTVMPQSLTCHPISWRYPRHFQPQQSSQSHKAAQHSSLGSTGQPRGERGR